MNMLRLGVIGTGLAFRELHMPVLTELEQKIEIVRLCTRTEAGCDAARVLVTDATGRTPGTTTDPSELVSSPAIDAVLIALPIGIAATIALRALEAGKHVFLEKPLAADMARAEEVISAARRENRVLLVGENFRYQRRFLQARKVVARGDIGQPLAYRLNDMHYTAPESKYAATAWRRRGGYRGGYLIDGGAHIVAGMRQMVGSPVAAVHGLSASFHPEVLGQQPDALFLHLCFANGLMGQMALGYGSPDRDARRPKVYGREGTLVLHKDSIEVLGLRTGTSKQMPLDDSGAGFREEWDDFLEAATTGRKLQHDAEEALVDLQVLFAGMDSADRGEVVTLKSTE